MEESNIMEKPFFCKMVRVVALTLTFTFNLTLALNLTLNP
jgi:hypothetical protein